MKLFVAAVGLLGVALAASSGSWPTEPVSRIDETAFRGGKTYKYNYDGQIASGLTGHSSQHSSTRVQARVSVHFETDRVAVLLLDETRIGSVQRELPKDKADVVPFDAFEQAELTSQQLDALRQPLRFRYELGLVSDVQFTEADQTWSANIKRAILNMLQVNIAKKSRTDSDRKLIDSNTEADKDYFYTANEQMLEGECEIAYTLAPTKIDTEKRITKAVNFEKCARRVDIRYGARFGSECTACEAKYTAEESNLESSSVMEMLVALQGEELLVKQTTLRSQYVLSPAAPNSPLAATYVLNKLTLLAVEAKKIAAPKGLRAPESLLYNTEWERALEKFRMTGDSEILKAAQAQMPFEWIKNKMMSVRKVLKALEKQIVKNEKDGKREPSDEFETSPELAHEFARLVELLRVCSHVEIAELHKELQPQQPLESLFIDACAVAGTHSAVHHLTKAMQANKISQIKASRVLGMLMTARYPSEKMVETLVAVCESPESSLIEQSCWLTTGALMHAVCGSAHRERTAYPHLEICPRALKNKFLVILEKRFERASTQYEKTLALKTFANAGLDISVYPLARIIADEKLYSRMTRLDAIDALRQLRSSMPRKLQSILMPLIKNNREAPQVRIAALQQLMQTIPERSIVDQLVELTLREPNHHVRAAVWSTLEAHRDSQIPCEKDLASDIAAALAIVRPNARLATETAFGKATYYNRESYLGAALNWGAIFGSDSYLPADLALSLETVAFGDWSKYLVQIGVAQENIDKLFHRLSNPEVLEKLFRNLELPEEIESAVVRGKRALAGKKPLDLLKSLMQNLKISPRQVSDNKAESNVIIYFRYADMDYAMVPINEKLIRKMLKEISAAKTDASKYVNELKKGFPFFFEGASYMYERTRIVATTIGLPLEVTSKLPTVTAIKGLVKLENQQVKLIAKPTVSMTHVVSMEVRSPIVSHGIKLTHALVAYLPIDLDLFMERESFGIKLNAPEEARRLLVLHSRPATYVRDELVKGYPKTIEKTIYVPESCIPMKELNTLGGEQLFGLNFEVRGIVARHLLENSDDKVCKVAPWIIAENHIELISRPTPTTPAQYSVLFSAKFERQSKMLGEDKPTSRFESFYGSKADEQPEFSAEKHETEALTRYVNSYDKTGYKALVKMVVKGRETYETLLTSACDGDAVHCRWALETTGKGWSGRVAASALLPAPVRSFEELSDRLHKDHREPLVVLEADWGCDTCPKNTLRTKMVEEQSPEMEVVARKLASKAAKMTGFEADSRLRQALKLNQIKMLVEYNVPCPYTRAIVSRLATYLKAAQPMSNIFDDVHQPKEYLKASADGKSRLVVKASVEPFSWRYVNVTVIGHDERIRIVNARLPFKLPTLNVEPISINNLHYSKKSIKAEAVCAVSSERINTFDEVVYRAPLTACHSVLTSDCSADMSFAVLMKEKAGRKTLKIVNGENVIELKAESGDKIICHVDGQKVEEREQLARYGVEFRGQRLAIFEDEKIRVRFDGQQAEIKVEDRYLGKVCGLCGHYDGDADNDFRRADGETTEDMPSYLRSYLAKQDDEDCQIDEPTISKKDNYKVIGNFVESSEESSEEESYERLGKSDKYYNNAKNYETDGEIEFVEVTRVIENEDGKLCFSKVPVPECRGNSHNKPGQTRQMKVPFTCLSRSSSDARSIQRELRAANGKIVIDRVASLPQSFVETLVVPKMCTVY